MAENPPSTAPKYIYKLIPSTAQSTLLPIPGPPFDLSTLPDSLPLSALDKRDSFIHLSTRLQLLGTLRNFFGNEDVVYVLRIPYERVEKDVRWEDAKGKTVDEVGGCWDSEGRAGLFPHVYNEGLRLGLSEIDAIGVWKKGADTGDGKGGWSADSWPWGEEDRPVELST
ncbi:hypothetical protein F5884DRAFT_85620 [Xylogone sp. PMI_703]|nr:hypothetical protein F5884DRAFT_85620 [Xylogone sp. PMI_703]